nr:MAG TPA: hypothetical protein [Caudoviricetes sp.]
MPLYKAHSGCLSILCPHLPRCCRKTIHPHKGSLWCSQHI